ncbi:MAG: hypothetical protein OHK0022_07090 [Roseiflexaceae bacterium]
MSERAVLIVDDNAASRQTAQRAVELVAQVTRTPLIALLAETGVEGLRMLRMQQPGVVRAVVLDLNFPGDVDGRLIGPLIRAEFPSIPIIPFTADAQAANPQHWNVFGLPEPVLKPCGPEVLAARIQTALDQPASGPLSPAQEVLVEQARLMVLMIQRQTLANRPLQIGMMVRSHLEEAGLRFVLSTVEPQLPLEIAVVSGQVDTVISHSRERALEVLLAVPSMREAAERVASLQRLPLLIYASIADARTLITHPTLSMVVGPATPDELINAFMIVLRGQRYVHPQLAGMLSLTPRQRQIIALLLEGATSEQIAEQIGLSPDRLRHVFAELYKQVGVPSVRQALVSWARLAPLHLLDER